LPTYPCPSSCLSQSLNGISVSKAVLVHKALAETEAASVLEVSRGSGPVQEVSTLLSFSYPFPLSSAPPVLPSSRPLLRPSPRPPFLCSSGRHVPWLPLFFFRATAAAMNKRPPRSEPRTAPGRPLRAWHATALFPFSSPISPRPPILFSPGTAGLLNRGTSPSLEKGASGHSPRHQGASSPPRGGCDQGLVRTAAAAAAAAAEGCCR
jgi:hypothetical protein